MSYQGSFRSIHFPEKGLSSRLFQSRHTSRCLSSSHPGRYFPLAVLWECQNRNRSENFHPPRPLYILWKPATCPGIRNPDPEKSCAEWFPCTISTRKRPIPRGYHTCALSGNAFWSNLKYQVRIFPLNPSRNPYKAGIRPPVLGSGPPPLRNLPVFVSPLP